MLDAIGDVRIEPGSADYMLLDRAVVDVVNALEDQDIFLRGLVRWLGFPLVTIPYARGTRQHGDSKFSLRRMVELALTGIAAHSVRPLRFAIWLALGFARGRACCSSSTRSSASCSCSTRSRAGPRSSR